MTDFYRLYLLDTDGHIIDRNDFHAADDEAAAHVADVVFDGCSEVYKSLELWNGAQRIAVRAQPAPNDSITRARNLIARIRGVGLKAEETISKIDTAIEEVAVTIETKLMQTNPELRESRRLLARLQAIDSKSR